MIDLINIESQNTVGLKIDGKIESKEFDALTTLLEKKMEDFPQVNVYVELESLGAVSPETILKDLQFVIKNKERIGKEAIVTDKKWIKKLTPVINNVFSDIEILAFSFEEKQQAKQWVKN